MSWGPVQIFTPAIYWNLLPHCSFDVFPSLPPYLNQMKSFLRSLNHQRAGRGSAAVKLSAHWLSYIINFQIYLDVFLSYKFGNIKNHVRLLLSSNCVAIIVMSRTSMLAYFLHCLPTSIRLSPSQEA